MDFEDNVEAPGMRVLDQGLPARMEPAATGERLDEEHGPRPTRRRRGNLPRVHDDIFHDDREARGRGSPQEIEVAPEDPRLREDGQRERICRRDPGQEETELRGVSDDRDRRRSKLESGNDVDPEGALTRSMSRFGPRSPCRIRNASFAALSGSDPASLRGSTRSKPRSSGFSTN